jgi:xanthine dehydrogenase large subunit
VGRSLPHESAVGHVTGRARYTGDLPEPPGLLHGWPVMASHARARVVALDGEAARTTPGVVAVLTARDVPGENEVGPVRRDEPLFPAEVVYHGQAVAWVLGESEAAARLGAGRVAVGYTPLPAILTLDEAIARESYHTEPFVIRRGDAERALGEVEHVLSGELRLGGQDHFYLEPHVALAAFDEQGELLVHSSTQHPTDTQEIVARVLGLARHRVVVRSLRMGGAFGGKEVQANQFAAVAALGAWTTQRPVRVRLNRDQDMILTGKRHPFLARCRVGFAADGGLVAVAVELTADGGFSLDLSEAVLMRALFHVDNAYYVPHLEVRGRVAKTNTTSHTAFRGFGGPQGMVVVEEIVDRVARTLGVRPEAVRERNLYRGQGETNTTHYGQEVEDNRLSRIWHDLVASSDLEARRAAIAGANGGSRRLKRGLAITPVKFGVAFTQTPLNQAGALVLVYPDGSVQVNHGGTEMGQGLHTKVWQVAAECLGVPLERVRLMPTGTDKVPNTSATAASSGSDLNGAAVRDACEALKARLAPVAAALLAARLGRPVDTGELVFADGRVSAGTDPGTAVGFAAVAHRAWQERISLAATGFYRTPGLHYDRAQGRGRPFHYYACGAAVSEVEVDGLTGEFRLLRVDILHDAGESLNPLVDRGQIEGGFVQGMGWLTTEELVWDREGRLLTHGPGTYKIPLITDVPAAFHVRLLPRSEQAGVIFGSKAVGEPPLMLAISVREAIRDAVAAFGGGGEVPLPSPATPEAILLAIEAAAHRPAAALPASG